MEEKVQKAFKNLAVYTIKATEKAILEIEKSINDKTNVAVKEQLIQRRKELDRDLDIIRKFLEE